MRSLAFVLFTSLTLLLSAQSWVPVPAIPTSNLCETISADTCQLSRSWDTFLVTHDGGLSYDSTNSIITTDGFMDMHFPSAEVGYACGGSYFGMYREVVVKTMDGGISWAPVTYNEFNCYTFDHVRFATDDIGLVAGQCSFLRTTDGGLTLQPIGQPPTGFRNVTDLYFDGTIGYATTINSQVWTGINFDIFQLIRTDDLGETWSVLYSDTLVDYPYYQDRRMNGIRTIGDFGLACGANGLVWRTTDGWNTWSEQQILNDTTFFYAIEIADEQTAFLTAAFAYAGAYRNTMQTNDGGLTWFAIPHKFHSISIKNGAGYALDETGQLWKNANVLLSVDETQVEGFEVFPNPTTNSVTVQLPEALSKGHFKVIDANGRIVSEQNFMAHTQLTIDLRGHAAGVYSLQITDVGSNKVYRERLVVQ